MFDFLNKSYSFNTDLKNSLSSISWISIGIFLFILFFQPFDLDPTDFNNYILRIAGLATITFFLISLIRIILPWSFPGLFRLDRWDLKREVVLELLLWILSSVAYSFYLAYVGKVNLSMYLVFKIVLLNTAPPVTIMVINKIQSLQNQSVELLKINGELNNLVDHNKDDDVSLVDLVSENRNEKLRLELNSLILVKSAENYVEILYRDKQTVQKKLLRSTLKGIEDQLKQYPVMIRCHRTCIVNTHFVAKLHRTPQGMRLKLLDYEEEIPVSRIYLLGVKSALELS